MATESTPASYTRSRTTNIPAKSVQSKQWKAIDGDLSILSSQDSSPPKSRPKKRKLLSKSELNRETYDDNDTPPSTPKKRKIATPNTGSKGEEKRLRLFRKQAPQSYLIKLERAVSQRMFVVGRTRGGTEAIPEETVEMAGTTGNIYSITIGLVPSCTCPDYSKGNQCKHIVYVLHNVLKAPEHLQYQLAFLSSELREILSQAPLPASSVAAPSAPSHRKEVAGDCPICFMEFEPENEEIVWCKAACGNNIHKHCFEQWAKSQKRMSDVRCVYCRTPWHGDEESIEKIKTEGRKNREGYVNVASQLGLSGRRDTSTYYQPWLRRQLARGYDYDEDTDEESSEDYDH
ncbi:MAG: hypothetical protein LQ343_003658 [Gyalolechia ehrenbergii]|nr:MAG: hypothetical protein LQ343_003658 [Gyalolechia ehrenbergii]